VGHEGAQRGLLCDFRFKERGLALLALLILAEPSDPADENQFAAEPILADDQISP
jgi:hypothetical protein